MNFTSSREKETHRSPIVKDSEPEFKNNFSPITQYTQTDEQSRYVDKEIRYVDRESRYIPLKVEKNREKQLDQIIELFER